MSHTVNMMEVFNSMDARKSEALATIAQYTEEQVSEASRIAMIYHRCDETSIKHLVDIAHYLKEQNHA